MIIELAIVTQQYYEMKMLKKLTFVYYKSNEAFEN
jgi:hypothetical protein